MEKQVGIKLSKTLFWIISFIKPYTKIFALILFCVSFISIIELSIPKFIQYFIDEISGSKNFNFNFIFLLLILFVFLMILTIALQNSIQRKFQENILKDIQVLLLKKINELGISYSDKHPVGSLLSLLNNEMLAVQKIYNVHFPNILKGSVFSLVSLIMMISMDYKLTLTIIPSLALYYLVGPYFEKKAEIESINMTSTNIKYNQTVYESMTALPELKLYGTEEWNKNTLMTHLNRHNKHMIKAFTFAFARGSVRRFTYYVGAVVFFIYGSKLVISGEITVGMFTAFLFYYFNTMHIMTSVITNITELKIKLYQVQKIQVIFDEKTDLVDSNCPETLENKKSVLKIKNLDFGYQNSKLNLKNINLEIKEGENVAFVGTSGSGKTTLAKLIARYYDPNKGEIYLDGVSIKDFSIEDYRNLIGFVFQETFLFGETIFDNIKFGNENATRDEVISASKKAFAHDFIMSLDNGYETVLTDQGNNLSGGQKQRISIARLFLKNPKILILDEITSSLDNESSFFIMKGLQELSKGKTVISIAHRISVVKDYDKIVYFDKGEIREKGNYHQLIKMNGKFKKMVMGEGENTL